MKIISIHNDLVYDKIFGQTSNSSFQGYKETLKWVKNLLSPTQIKTIWRIFKYGGLM